MNARTKPELKPKRGELCPVCHVELLTLECEVDAARCVDCQAEEARLVHPMKVAS